MDEELLKKAIQQAKANVELETTPITEQFNKALKKPEEIKTDQRKNRM